MWDGQWEQLAAALLKRSYWPLKMLKYRNASILFSGQPRGADGGTCMRNHRTLTAKDELSLGPVVGIHVPGNFKSIVSLWLSSPTLGRQGSGGVWMQLCLSAGCGSSTTRTLPSFSYVWTKCDNSLPGTGSAFGREGALFHRQSNLLKCNLRSPLLITA